MSSRRTHHVTTTDGVAIGGAVRGQGPPLVFLQGVIGDCDIDWQRVLGHLTGQFTCHLQSMRGRGHSGDHSNLSYGRLVDDVLAYIDSIGEPTGLVGWSLGAELALAVAAQSDAVAAVAALEPGMPGLWDKQEQAALGGAVARIGELAAEGRLADAARALAGFPSATKTSPSPRTPDTSRPQGATSRTYSTFFQQQMQYQGPTADDPAVPGARAPACAAGTCGGRWR